MKIAFIGTGGMADALATKWTGKHDLFFGGRSPDKAAALVAKFGGGAGDIAQAAAFGDVVVLATHNEAVFDAIAQAGGAAAFAGKLVLDINNPISIETFRTTRTDGRSLTEAIEEALPDAHVAKAFNMASTVVWRRDPMLWDGRPLVVPFTAADGAVAATRRLIEDTGARALHVGDNAYAYQLEAAAALVIKQLFAGADQMTVLTMVNPADKPI